MRGKTRSRRRRHLQRRKKQLGQDRILALARRINSLRGWKSLPDGDYEATVTSVEMEGLKATIGLKIGDHTVNMVVDGLPNIDPISDSVN